MRLSTGLVVAVLAWNVAGVFAQTYPAKQIRIVVPFAPGGNVDITARILGAALTEQFGQQMIVDNRAGAGGTIGGNLVAKSAPDGYTLLMGSSGSVTAGPAVFTNLPYDPIRDFAAISLVHLTANVIVASSKSPVPQLNLHQLIEFAKKHPAQVTMAHAGVGSLNHLTIELLNATAGVKFLPVSYKGGAPALVELLGGQIDTMMEVVPTVMAPIREGRLKAIAIASLKRSSVMPDIPTFDESGLKGFESSNLTGVLAPAGTPPAIISTLNAALIKAVRTPAVRQKFLGLGAEPQDMTPEQFSTYIRNDIEKWKKAAEFAGVKTQL